MYYNYAVLRYAVTQPQSRVIFRRTDCTRFCCQMPKCFLSLTAPAHRRTQYVNWRNRGTRGGTDVTNGEHGILHREVTLLILRVLNREGIIKPKDLENKFGIAETRQGESYITAVCRKTWTTTHFTYTPLRRPLIAIRRLKYGHYCPLRLISLATSMNIFL